MDAGFVLFDAGRPFSLYTLHIKMPYAICIRGNGVLNFKIMLSKPESSRSKILEKHNLRIPMLFYLFSFHIETTYFLSILVQDSRC